MKKIAMTRIAIPVLIAACFYNCGPADENASLNLTEIASLKIKEISGLEYVNNTLWGIEDSGNAPNLYRIDPTTGAHTAYTVNAANNDWEDITSDAQGNLYIGDFGNNENDRHNLSIIKVSADNPTQALYTVSFYYPEQTDFPPKKKKRNFDCEGFFEYNGYFYLFSKNRGFENDGTVLVHKVPNTPGNHPAQAAGSFITCDNFNRCAIAGADISPDGKTVALISGDKLWTLTDYKDDAFASGKLTAYTLGEVTQKESVCFQNAGTLYVADEKSGKKGGKLYSVKLK